MEELNLFPVFNRQIATDLILSKFKLEKIEKNLKYNNFDVYFFEKSPEFDAAFYQAQILHKSKKIPV